MHRASTTSTSVRTSEMREFSNISAIGDGIIINPAVSSSSVELPEIGDSLTVAAAAITIANISKTNDGHWQRPALTELPYSLRTRKLKIATIALIVSLDGFIMPTCMFYILKYIAHLNDTRSSSFFCFSILHS